LLGFIDEALGSADHQIGPSGGGLNLESLKKMKSWTVLLIKTYYDYIYKHYNLTGILKIKLKVGSVC
jgi:hypothetical protein